MESGFYKTFLDILNSPIEESDPADLFLKLKDAEKYKSPLQKIEEMVPALKRAMAKPQKLIEDNKDWYIAQDLNTNTFYICYRTLMMVDIDFYKGSSSESQEEIINKLDDYAILHCLRFKVYKSRNGIHAFLVSRKANYRNLSDIKIMTDMGTDFFYAVYSHVRGWSVRLNRKVKESLMSYPYLRDIGDLDLPSDLHLEKLINLHLNLIEVFADDGPSQMFGN